MRLKHIPHNSIEWLALASAELTDGARIRSAHITYGTLLASSPRPSLTLDAQGGIVAKMLPEMGWPDVVALIAPGANLEEVASELEHLAGLLRKQGAPLLPAGKPREENGSLYEERERREQLRAARAGETWLSDGVMPSPTITRPSPPHEG